MKWFKHISDSLDDPFVFELLRRYGGDGYLTFFGILEIYSREFHTEAGWKLNTTQAYLKSKLYKRQSTLIVKSLEYIKNSGKWDVEFNGDNISIFIPKFRELLDESTLKKLREHEQSFRNSSGTIPKTEATEEDKDKDINIVSRKDFDLFYKAYPNKKAPAQALKAWKKLNGTRPPIESIIEAIKKQVEWRKNANGQFRPPWKHPATWLNGACWNDEADMEDSKKEEKKPWI